MDASKRNVSDIFNGSRILEIPFFQRAYVWGEPQWERMLEDVEHVSESNRPYFMGSVIFKQQPTVTGQVTGDQRIVVDGQQRLTTLSLLLKALTLLNGEGKKFDKRFRLDDDSVVLRHNYNDIEAYNRIMALDHLPDQAPGSDSLSKAFWYFAQKLDPAKVSFEAVCSIILLVVIDLGADEDEQQIFDTINSLGVRLTTAELLKNYFFGRQDIHFYHAYWRDIFEKDEETREYWDQEITSGSLRRSFIDIFFFSFLQIKIQDSSLNVRTEDKLFFSKLENLFLSYKRFIKEYFGSSKLQMLEEIRSYALLFRQAFSRDVLQRELPAEAGIERMNAIVFALDTTTLLPYLLFIEKNVQDLNVKNELYATLESYIMRRLISRETNKNYNQLFAERLILNRILTREEFLSYIERQSDRVNRMPADEDVRTGFHRSVVMNKIAAGILYLMESRTRNRAQQSTGLLGLSQYSLEHLMPKKWRNHWPDPQPPLTDDQRDRQLLTLGNLTIITQSLNTSIRDASWSVKLEGKGGRSGLKQYTQGMETVAGFLNCPDWNEAEIDKRADYLADKALEIWPEN